MSKDETKYVAAIMPLSGDTREALYRSQQNFQEEHAKMSALIASGWTVVASHIYVTSVSFAWLYVWLVKLPDEQD